MHSFSSDFASPFLRSSSSSSARSRISRSSCSPRAIVTALELISPTPDQAVASPPLFRWRESPGCHAYVLEIFDEEMLPLWSSEKTSHPEFLLPSEVFLKLAPGRSYYWMVTGFSPDLETQESVLQRFSLRRH